MCQMTVAGRTVKNGVYAAPLPEMAIMGMPTILKLGCVVTIAGQRIASTNKNTSLPSRRLATWRVRKVVAAENVTLSPWSEVV
jgi:hypothetical protein